MRATNLLKVQQQLDCTVYVASPAAADLRVQAVVASDLMSEVLATDEIHFLLVTSLSTSQVVYTADIVGAVGVLLVNGKQPLQETIELARAKGVPLLSTKQHLFECCLNLGELMELGRQLA